MSASKRFATLALALLLCMAACSPGSAPYRMVQLCVTSQDDLQTLKDLLQAAAKKRGFEYFDRSDGAAAEAERIKTRDSTLAFRTIALMISARGSDGEGVGIGAWPTSSGDGYDVVVGMTEANGLAMSPFAEDLASDISKRWKTDEVPKGEGARPLESCEDGGT